MRLLLVSASRTSLLYSLFWTVPKAARTSWLSHANSPHPCGGSRARLPLQGTRRQGLRGPHPGLLAGSPVAGGPPCLKPKPSQFLPGREEKVRRSPQEGNSGLFYLELKIRGPIFSLGHYQMIEIQSPQKDQDQGVEIEMRGELLLPGPPRPYLPPPHTHWVPV